MTTTTYYFDSYDVGTAWGITPSYMVDGNIATFASTAYADRTQLNNANTDSETLGTISKVELRTYGYSDLGRDIYLTPVFDGVSSGDIHTIDLGTSAAYSIYADITNDTNAPLSWAWTDIQNLDVNVITNELADTFYVGVVEILVTHFYELTANNLTSGTPILDSPTLRYKITAINLTGGTPSLDSPILVGWAILATSELISRSAELGSPTLYLKATSFAALASYTETIGDGLSGKSTTIDATFTPFDETGNGLSPYTDAP